MIKSILDNDLYKFTMQQAVRRLYPDAWVGYEFTNRGKTTFPEGFAGIVKERVAQMADLQLSREEQAWLETACPYFTADYLDYLYSYRFDPGQVQIEQQAHRLSVTIKGPWYQTILWEVPVMAVICESFYQLTKPKILSGKKITARNQAKAGKMSDAGLTFVDFGTRRRFSFANQAQLLDDILAVPDHRLAGTSNVHLAKRYDLAPVGTLAHEWIMFHSALAGFHEANAAAMDAWLAVYPDVLGIALTDTFTTPVFLDAFSKERAAQFSGVRHDSGDPGAFIRRIIGHYREKGIDPASKVVVFSDGLDADRAIEIHKLCKGKVKDSYGIGTYLTNDVGVAPLNIVIKLSWARPEPGMDSMKTVKLSDDPGKHTGDPKALSDCCRMLGL